MDGEAVALLVIFLPHAVGGAFLGWRLMPKGAREELRSWWRDAGDDGGGGGPGVPRVAGPRPGGGGSEPPLPDATPSPVRLRQPARLADRVPPPARRPAHPPQPQRAPQRERT